MIALLHKKSLKFFHPILRRLVKFYLSKPRKYTYEDLKIDIMPTVFHPGLFFSTKVFLEFLNGMELGGKQVLELGAGSGLISLRCAQMGAIVTASDINQVALNAILQNAKKNNISIKTILSDLFDAVEPSAFDFILINPPYYPKKPTNVEENAWFCGEGFEYFHNLFKQLKPLKNSNTQVFMILSEDCDIEEISSIAKENNFSYNKIYSKTVSSEENYIFEFKC